MTLSVLIPTYRRPQDLARCLQGLMDQTRQPNEIIIVVRDVDQETWKYLKSNPFPSLPITVYCLRRAGKVAALNEGLQLITGEIVATLDDDAEPRPNWLKSIEIHFRNDAHLGAVGGRDWIYENGHPCEPDVPAGLTVGKLQWFGRIIGNHHLGSGEARTVDCLKGANMSFRRSAIAHMQFDERLRGSGAQPCEDLFFCLQLKQAGWKLLYDPEVAVNHHVNLADNSRAYVCAKDFKPTDVSDFGYNHMLMLWEHLPSWRRLAFLVWTCLVGTRQCPGFVQAIRLMREMGGLSWQRYFAFQQGQIQAIRDLVWCRPWDDYPPVSTTTLVESAILLSSSEGKA